VSRKAGRRVFWAACLFLGLAGFLVSLLTGPVHTGPGDLLRFVTHPDRTHQAIFVDLRLSRAVLAFLVGAALALSGAILQGYFRNPMADPFVVGVSSGASLGAVLAAALGFNAVAFGFSGPGLLAFLSGLGIVSLVYALSLRRGGAKVETILLTGIAAGALASAMTSFFLFMRSDSYDQAVFWLLGSFQLAEWRQVAVPHWVRLLIGPSHRTLFAASALAGGTFLLYCDLLARELLPAELPIGVITAAVGAPFFIYLLHKKR
jgi:iron complex transport system permease protein